MDSSTLCATLNGKWQPDDDHRHKLILNGDGHFTWVGEVSVGPNTPVEFDDDRPLPSVGTWSVEDSKLVLNSSRANGDRDGRIEYTVKYNAAGTEITLTTPDGVSRRFTRLGDTRTEHPSREAARRARFGLTPG